MRLTYLATTFTLAITLIFSGCQNQSKNNAERVVEGDKIIVAGKIKNPKGEEVAFRIAPNGERKSFKLDKKGEFHGKLSLSTPSYLKFLHANQYTDCYAEPGDSLYLTLNTNRFDETVKHSGNRAFVNNYLASKILLQDSIPLVTRQNARKFYSQAPKSFVNTIDSVHNIYEKHFQKYFKKQKPSETFKKYEQANIDYKFYQVMARYPMLYKRLNRGKEPDLPEDYYSYREKVNFNNPQLLNVPNYQNYIQGFTNLKVRSLMQNNPEYRDTPRAVVYTKILKEEIPNDTIKARLLGDFLHMQVMRNGIEGLKPVLAYYETLPYSQSTKAKIDSVKKKWENLEAGNPAPGFAYPNTKGDTVSLKDLRGSYIYIDAWATWCGPCIREIPYLKDLHKKFKDQNIKFVSISLDKENKKQKWKEMVKNKDLKGIQLIANGNAFESKLAQDYLINSIPRFILINPKGEIIDANAERPSGNIGNRFEKLLAKES